MTFLCMLNEFEHGILGKYTRDLVDINTRSFFYILDPPPQHNGIKIDLSCPLSAN